MEHHDLKVNNRLMQHHLCSNKSEKNRVFDDQSVKLTVNCAMCQCNPDEVVFYNWSPLQSRHHNDLSLKSTAVSLILLQYKMRDLRLSYYCWVVCMDKNSLAKIGHEHHCRWIMNQRSNAKGVTWYGRWSFEKVSIPCRPNPWTREKSGELFHVVVSLSNDSDYEDTCIQERTEKIWARDDLPKKTTTSPTPLSRTASVYHN